MVPETESKKMFLSGKGLDPLDWETLQTTVFPRFMRLAQHLEGSACSAAAMEIPVQERGNGEMHCHG